MVALITLLLVPLGPMVLVFDQISNQLAAESIARHGLRYAFLAGELASDPTSRIKPALDLLASNWGKEISEFNLDCVSCREGGLLELSVRVGSSWAYQSAGLEPD